MKKKNKIIWLSVLLVAVFVAVSFFIFNKKNMQYWLIPYLKWEFTKDKTNNKPKHIMFLICDHFEPTTLKNMKNWTSRWPDIVKGHKDADGVIPQYTWFYFLDGYKAEVLKELSKLPKMGMGEIEVHLHHSNDTPKTFREKLRRAKREYQKVGALITIDGKEHFAYIAGNWALDNSVITEDGRNRSGVNSELIILNEEGCYSDFTFPNLNMAMPEMINTIYYATDDPKKPKSYNTGVPVTVGGKKVGDLMIFEGPLSINIKDWRHIIYPAINTANIQASNPPLPIRVDEWIRVGVHVKGKADWIFVKCHTHGAHPPIREMLLSSAMKDMFSYFEKKYNDGINYVLHYVTAREAYNIVKAAEAGKNGNPNEYRNFLVQPYQNSLRKAF